MLSTILITQAALCSHEGREHQKLLGEGRLHNNQPVSSLVFLNSSRHLMACPHWMVCFFMSSHRLHSVSSATGASFPTNAANDSAEGWREQPPIRGM